MKTKLVLKSIEEEAADCRKAFENFPVGGFVLHCHHEVLGETLREPAESRIRYILTFKVPEEQALRLRLFRPVSQEYINSNADRQKAYADYQKAYADYQKADADYQKADADRQKAYADRQKAHADLTVLIHDDLCPGCPWNGYTIFPDAK